MLNNLLQKRLKLLQKEQFKKLLKTTDDLIGNKISDRITKASKTIGFFKERYISLEQEK